MTPGPGTARGWRRALLAGSAALMLLALAACKPGRPPEPGAAAAVDPNDPAAFSVLAGSELKDLEPALLQAAQRAGVKLQLRYAGTLDIVERVNGGEAVDAILPPNGAYPVLALSRAPLARDKLFYSRIALGIKPAVLARLGWDKTPPGWREIAEAAGAGQLRFAMTNAAASNTGMSALFAVASASAGKTEDLAVADIQSPIIQQFLSGQKLTAGSSGWLADAFVRAPQELDAMVNYEAVILRANARLQPADQLRLVYPRDGMISADYPLMLLAAGKRAAYDKLVAAIKGEDFQRDALGPLFLRPANAAVSANPALPTQAVVELSFPGKLEVIDAVLASYQSEWRKPSTSIFVLDISGSMKGQRVQSMRDALKVLSGADARSAAARFAAFQRRERVALIAFDDEVEPPLWIGFDAADLGPARATLIAAADRLEARGGTAIFDALDAAERLAQAERRRDPSRFVSIVLLTDGESNTGLRYEDFLVRWADKGAAPVFPILFGEGNVPQMQALAKATGGREFDGRQAQLGKVFREIRGYQ